MKIQHLLVTKTQIQQHKETQTQTRNSRRTQTRSWGGVSTYKSLCRLT